MSLVNEQALFLQDILKLIPFANSLNFIVTARELGRTQEQQELYLQQGKTKTLDSQHRNNTAIDLYFFEMKDGIPDLILDKAKLQPIGLYWESLDKKNHWGGNWKFLDVPHFERTV